MISRVALRKFIDITVDNDALVIGIFNGVVADFEMRTRRMWKQRTSQVERVEVPRERRRNRYLFLKGYPSTPTAVIQTAVDGSTSTLELGVDLDISGEDGSIENLRVDSNGDVETPWGRFLDVTLGTVGYADDAAPADILQALGLELRMRMDRNSPGKLTMVREAIQGSGSVELTPIEECHPAFKRAVTAYTNRGR